jgi:hypothetical protein
MQDKNITIHLLEYYAGLSAHHRVMMVGFATVYFAINQALLLTPLPSAAEATGRVPLALVLSAGLLTTFVLSATLHHACHFCANAGMKAIMAADMHYRHLPQEASKADDFVRWINSTASQVREAMAVPVYSVLLLAVLFGLLAATNGYIYLGLSNSLLANTHFDAKVIFIVFSTLQVLVILAYGLTFVRHFRYFRIARRELALIMQCSSRMEADLKIEKLGFKAPPNTTVVSQLPSDRPAQ